MQRNVPAQDDSESSIPESIAKEQNPAMTTEEEHEPYELAKGMYLGVLVLTVSRGSSQVSFRRTTWDIEVGDGMIPRGCSDNDRIHEHKTAGAGFHITNKNQDYDYYL